MNEHTSNNFSNIISVIALVVSMAALYFSWEQHSIDYDKDKAVIIKPGTLPINRIKEGQMPLDLEFENTSKKNLQYYLSVKTNIGCIKGENEQPLLIPCSRHKSQIVSLGKSGSEKNSYYKHALNLDVPMVHPPLAYMSEPNYYLTIEVFDPSNDQILFRSDCYYYYETNAKAFVLDQPVLDTTGESNRRQGQCLYSNG